MDNVKFFIDGERIYAGHEEEEEMEDNFYTTFKEVSLLNSNKEEIRKIKGEVYVDKKNIYSSFEDAKKASNAFVNTKKRIYLFECSTLKGLLNFPLNYIMINGKIDKDAVEAYKEMKDKMLQTIYGEEK